MSTALAVLLALRPARSRPVVCHPSACSRTSIRHARALEIARIRATAERERQTVRIQAEVTAREEALVLRTQVDGELRANQSNLPSASRAGRANVLANEEARALDELRSDLGERETLSRSASGKRRYWMRR